VIPQGTADIKFVNAGFALDGSISATPTTINLFTGDTATSNLTFTNNASHDSTSVNNSNISASTSGSITSVTANNVGSSIVSVQAKDGYDRTRTDLTTTINVNVKQKIEGVVFKDNNYNSLNDDSSFLNNITVQLLDGNTNAVLKTTTTDSNGKYAFEITTSDKPTGTSFKIKVLKPNGYIVANKGVLTNTNDNDIDISSLESDVLTYGTTSYSNVNAGFALDGSVTATPNTINAFVRDVVTDVEISYTNNASMDRYVLRNDDILISVTGNTLSIEGKKVSDYRMIVYAKDGYGRTRNDLSAVITYNFKQKIEGTVFKDNNYNSLNDDSSFMSNVSVQLLDGDTNTVLKTTTTDNNGKYIFEIATTDKPSGTAFKIKVDKPAGYIVANKGLLTNSNDSDVDITTLTTDKLTYGNANYSNVNAGLALDVSVSVANDDLSTNVSNTAQTNYTITNGSYSDTVIDDTTLFSVVHNSTSELLTFTALDRGTTFATLSVLDGYNRVRTDKNVNIDLSANILRGSIKYHVKFLDNSGTVTNVPDSYLQGFSARLYDGNTVIAERRINLLSRIGSQEYEISNLELTDSNLRLEVTKPSASNLELVDSSLNSHNGEYPITYTQGQNHDVDVYVSDKLLPLTSITKNGEVNGYNPKTFTENHIENETEIVNKDINIYNCNDDYSTCDNKREWNVKTPTNDGYYKVEYQVKDLANNLSEFKTLQFKVDKTPPKVELTIKNDINPSADDLSLLVNDNMDKNPKVNWRIINEKNRVIASGNNVELSLPSNLGHGNYKVIVNAVDEAGNKIEVIKGFNISYNGIESEIPSTGSNELFIMMVLMISSVGLIFGLKKNSRTI
jgi:hypothetical protein